MVGKTTSTSSPRIANLAVQTSVLGLPIARGWGRGRIKCNLLWFGDFKSIAKTTKQGGKAGGVKNTTYTYTASIILGLCEGPIVGVRTVYKDKSVQTLSEAGLSLATGEIGQAPWTYMTSAHPTEALGYSGIAYLYAQDYALTEGASLPNHSFEVDFESQVSGLPDADPADIVADTLGNTVNGVPGWTPSMTGSLVNYSDYCLASNLLLSPVLEDQRTVSDFLSEIMQATNSEIVWSSGVLKVIPYGDEERTDNGVTWTPDLTPVYDLDENDFIPQSEESGPVSIEIVDQTDAYNIVQVEHLDRDNQYNTDIQTAQDLANITEFGPRKKDPISLHAICVPETARQVASLILQRSLYRREKYRFTLPWEYVLLEPMDYVTLSTESDELQLDRLLVQIEEIDEDEDGNLSVLAEGVSEGTSSAPLYPSHSSSGFFPNLEASPGSVEPPLIINAPTSLTNGENQVWIAAAGLNPLWGGCEVWVSPEGTDYQMIGEITDPCRLGVTTATLPASADPDTTNTLSVDLSESNGQLETTTQEGADVGATLFWVGGEIGSYRDADLVAANEYDITSLRRGLYGTSSVSHASGTRFARLDDAVFRHAYGDLGVGSEFFVKLRSYNIFRRGLEDLSSLPAYTLSSLAPVSALPEPVSGIVNTTASGNISLQWTASVRATSYRAHVYDSTGTTHVRSDTITAPSWTYTSAQQTADGGPLAAYKIYLVAVNESGESTHVSYTVILTVGGGAGGAQPAAPTNGYATSPEGNYIDAGCDPVSGATGYVLYVSGTTGFTPTGAPNVTSAFSLLSFPSPPGYRYIRIAAVNDNWDGDVADLNFTAEISVFVPDYSGYCPHPDTLILLAGGSRCRAGSLRPGMVVRTMHETTLEWGEHTVLSVQSVAGAHWRTRFEDGRELVSSGGHRVHTDERGWVSVHQLESGDLVTGHPGGTVVDVTPEGSGAVVRITVQDAHTYIAGGLLSHNIKA